MARNPRLAVLACALVAACQSLPGAGPIPVAPALLETPPVGAAGDAADDPAIWVAPNAAESLIIGTQKQGGLYVYDLGGRLVQELSGGRPNNVDLRADFPWAGGVATIVGASDRTDNALAFWRLDPRTRRLETHAPWRTPTGFVEVYGFCIGRMADAFVAVATDRDSGDIGVWRIAPGAEGALTSARIASFSLGSITEGCVVDDARGVYYLAQETHGIWEVDLNDATGARRRLIDRVGAGGNLVADVEGLALWTASDGTGYLVASVQGQSRFAVYERGGAHAYRGSFRIGAARNGAADAVTGTDGIDIVSADLGGPLSRGLMVAQDDVNTSPTALQNFKFIAWSEVEAALGLGR